MASLVVPGREIPALEDLPVGSGRFLNARIARSVQIDATRAVSDEVTISDITDKHVIELTLDGGVKWWTTLEELRALETEKTRGEAAGKDEIRLPAAIYAGEPSRGLGKWFLKGLNLIDVDLPGGTAKMIAQRMEQQLTPGPGLYRCTDPGTLKIPAQPTDFEGSRPSLLFIHGTASSTAGSFSGLTEEGNAAAWQALQADYQDRIFAFEHETLSKSPLENVVDLLDKLPKKATLHLVSHSRGGIVGEILARRSVVGRQDAFDQADAEVFRRSASDDNDRQNDLDALDRINALFKEKQILVERFVRVGCPAAGTTLASRRLDRYLNIIVNLLGRIPGLQASQIYDFATAFLMAVVKERMNPATLPGLEAQMPGAPLIRILNNPAVQLQSELLVISGDVERSGFWRSLQVFATDLFYRADHDFVVNTASMYGGAPRTARAYFFFDKSSEVDHFHYFRNRKTQKALVAGLKGQPGAETGYRPIEPDQKEVSLKLAAARGGAPRPVLFVLPGIMGSHLAVGKNRIWLDLFDIATGKMQMLRIDAGGVIPDALIGSAYADLVDFLQDSHVVVPFPYDWRKSIYEAANLLAEDARKRLYETDQPVRILAHSMGGLVARTMITEHPDVWKRMKEREGCRLLMLGTPNGGSYIIPRVLLGREKIFRFLHIADLFNSSDDLLDIISRYPGILEMLPMGHEPDDFFDETTWATLKAAAKSKRDLLDLQDLKNAARLRETLKQPLEKEYVLYVAGQAPATPCRHEVADGKIRFIATPHGDGRVTWAKGIPPELREANTWYMDVEHGKLADHRRAFPALVELLQRGDTTLLHKDPPAIARGIPSEFEMPDDEPSHFPDDRSLAGAALGFEPTYATTPGIQRVKVYVTQGDLGYARYPVAVGHHKGDGIVSAERVLDHYIHNRLTERHRLGLYPGDINTAEVILEGTMPLKGAIVLGLGNFGELTAGDLTQSVTHAALALAMKKREQAMGAGPAKNGEPPRPLGISTLLIGSGFGGLTIRASLRALLLGVQQANQRLRSSNLPDVQTIDAVEFIEIFEDRAVQAARALQEIVKEERFTTFTLAEDHIRRVSGGWRRLLEWEQDDWWHRLKVGGENKSYLTFTSLTDRARAPVDNLPTQRALMDQLIEQAVQQPNWDGELAQTMFELLIPNHFKEYAADRRNILWIVDQESAKYPWELLHDPSRGDQEPIAVQAGVLRQLAVSEYRPEVEMPSEPRALVVGDPLNNNDEFPELLGAQQEANLVADLLATEAFEVERHVKKSAVAVITALFKHNYRVIHLAGHGVVDYLPPDQRNPTDPCEKPEGSTGMVLGDGTFLTPGVIEQMRQVPDLVFVNCCHLGRVEAARELRANRHKLAANLGTQLIQMGVRAVVAAGWAVNDAAAETFARTFYEEMLRGTPFGEAVRRAREKTYLYHPQSNTWGAYQCYGDPYYTLRGTGGSHQESERTYVDPLEVVIELQNIASRAEAASSRSLQQLGDQLKALLPTIPRPWMDRGDVVEAIANAYAVLDLISEAVVHYEAVCALEKATYSISALEQLANLKARWGAAIATKDGADKEDVERGKRYIQESINQLERLLKIAETTERLSLLGSAYKRLAVTLTEQERVAALVQSADYYERAYRLALDLHDIIDHYPLVNWLTVDAILVWYGEKQWNRKGVPGGKELENLLSEAETAAAQMDAVRPSFWELSAPATISLFRLIKEGDKKDTPYRHDIIDLYRRAWARGGSYKHRRSIEEHYDFLIAMMNPLQWDEETAARASRQRKDREMQKLARMLHGILDELDEIMKE